MACSGLQYQRLQPYQADKSCFKQNTFKRNMMNSDLAGGKEGIIGRPISFMLATALGAFLLNFHGVDMVRADTLTANDVIRMDIAPRLYTLKDVLFILKSFPDYISQKDYTTVRNLLRQGQPSSLRVTCRKIIQYLPSKTEQAEFKAAYTSMIDALDDFDTVSITYILFKSILINNRSYSFQ